jgi:uncharacterized membrane protein YecN with MAPEG domain
MQHGLHGLLRTTRRHRQSPRRHYKNGHRAAVVRAATAARLYLDGSVPSLAAAAEACGSNIHYVRSAVALLKAEDSSLLGLAMAGWVSLTGAALQAGRITVNEAVTSWRVWTPEQRAEFGRSAGVAEVWDFAISPVITEDRASQVQAAE